MLEEFVCCCYQDLFPFTVGITSNFPCVARKSFLSGWQSETETENGLRREHTVLKTPSRRQNNLHGYDLKYVQIYIL